MPFHSRRGVEALFEAPMHLSLSLTRAEEVDLPAWIDVHEYVRAHFGPGSERYTEKPASLSLDFREKDGPRPMLQVGSNHVPFTV